MAARWCNALRLKEKSGQEILGLFEIPKCKGTSSTGGDKPAAGSAPSPVEVPASHAGSKPQKSGVMWVDGTLRGDGWRCQHVSISGSLRELQIFESEFAQTAFIARQDLPAYEPADLDTRCVIDMWTKVLARGSAPPIHPTTEHELLRREGFGEGDFKAPAYPGDLAPRIVKPHRLELFVPVGESADFDPLGDSDAENDFLTWISKLHPELVPFVTPQASFDLLVAAHGGEKISARRSDRGS